MLHPLPSSLATKGTLSISHLNSALELFWCGAALVALEPIFNTEEWAFSSFREPFCSPWGREGFRDVDPAAPISLFINVNIAAKLKLPEGKGR